MRFIIPIILFVFIGSCGTDSGSDSSKISLEGSFAQAGLPDIYINTFNQFEGNVYVATEGGLYRSPEVSKNLSWSSLGLQNKKVLKVVFLPGGKFLAALRISDFSNSIPSMYLSVDDGQSWQVWVNNYGGETGEYTWVESLAAVSNPSDTLFARVSGHTVARSINGGQEWKIVNGDWNLYGGAAVLILPDRFKKGRIFAGGVNAISQPYLLQSEDYGENWTILNLLENEEAVCYDLLIHPSDTNTLLAALGGVISPSRIIRKTTDNGKTWTTVFEGINTFTLAQSPKDVQVVYATGLNSQGTLFFAASSDFGDTWETVEFEDGPTQIQVNDMISVLQNGKEVLYFGTNKGVYSYTFTD